MRKKKKYPPSVLQHQRREATINQDEVKPRISKKKEGEKIESQFSKIANCYG